MHHGARPPPTITTSLLFSLSYFKIPPLLYFRAANSAVLVTGNEWRHLRELGEWDRDQYNIYHINLDPTEDSVDRQGTIIMAAGRVLYRDASPRDAEEIFAVVNDAYRCVEERPPLT